jgi:hypothetical protein
MGRDRPAGLAARSLWPRAKQRKCASALVIAAACGDPSFAAKNGEFDGFDVSFFVDTYTDTSRHPNEKDIVADVVAPRWDVLSV